MPSPTHIAYVTPTVCRLMGIPSPYRTEVPAPAKLVNQLAAGLGKQAAKCLLYAPDALGASLVRKYADDFLPVKKAATLEHPTRAAFPPKTPVCFASMFTGTMPATHSIRLYERPVLTCDTLFDALVRAGKKVAIIAVTGSSIDLIFRNRPITYYSEPGDLEVLTKAVEVVTSEDFDFILVYQQAYDDVLHAETPESPLALLAMRNHIAVFESLVNLTDKFWQPYPHIVAFLPDHGAHIDQNAGKGTHGEDIPDDMEVLHYWRVQPARK